MIARMKKLTLACLKSDADRLCRELTWLEAVECKDIDGRLSEMNGSFSDSEKELADYERQLQKLADAIDILSVFGEGKKKSIYRSCTRSEFEAFGDKMSMALECADKALGLSKEIALVKGKINKAENEISSLVPFEKYDEVLSFDGTRSVSVVKGTFPKLTKMADVRTRLDEQGFAYELEELGQFGDGIYVYTVIHKEDSDSFFKALSAEGFSRIILSGYEGTPKEEIKKLRELISSYENEIITLKNSQKELASNLGLLKDAYDYSTFLVESGRIKCFAVSTESACILSGWVPESREKALSEKLDELECAYKLEEPADDDKVPVKLENNRFASPFESVLGLYSYPDYRGIDPTFVMSIFYFIIFGLIMQDFIYGLILTFGCKAMIKLMHVKKGTGLHKMLNMFSICGISTMVCGILFGGYMGDLPSAIATKMFGMESFPELAVALNPVTNPMPYLVISMVMGALHLIAGMLMKAYMLIKRGHMLDAVFDIGLWLVLFAGIGLLLVAPNVGKWVAIAGVAGLILTQGRKEKNPIMKLLKGIMSLYDIVSYVSDLLSYSRIMALGLSGAIIGQVVNIIGTLGGASVVGFIVLIFALVLGHTLNLALSVLGAFVHTARLQYIEFLGKFFEDGGEEYKPSKIKTKYTDIAKEAK